MSAVQASPLLDEDSTRELFKPCGPWAARCGAAVRQRRKDLGLTLQTLADLSGTSLQTVSRIESGQLVPRDRLKAAISFALALEVDQLWTWPSRQEMFEKAAAL